jgi:TatD DNase family protein
MWIDTHCHLDAAEFDADRAQVLDRARLGGVRLLVIPAVEARGFAQVRQLAHAHGHAYALGIHPLYVDRMQPGDLEFLAALARSSLTDPRFVAIGEIGLDQFAGAPDLALQEPVYRAQLRLAAELGLPVIVHVRRSADRLLYHLRRQAVAGGIVHAFNGSPVQAQGFLDLGLRLGFGGAATYDGSLRIRRLATQLPLGSLVVETDAPDIPAQWLRHGLPGQAPGRNEPGELPRIGAALAQLRGLPVADFAEATALNAVEALPRLGQLLAA